MVTGDAGDAGELGGREGRLSPGGASARGGGAKRDAAATEAEAAGATGKATVPAEEGGWQL